MQKALHLLQQVMSATDYPLHLVSEAHAEHLGGDAMNQTTEPELLADVLKRIAADPEAWRRSLERPPANDNAPPEEAEEEKRGTK